MLSDLWEKLKSEWLMIKQFPISFVTVSAIMAAIIVIVVYGFFETALNLQQSTISAYKARYGDAFSKQNEPPKKAIDEKTYEPTDNERVVWMPPSMRWDVDGITFSLGGHLNQDFKIAQGKPIGFPVDTFKPQGKIIPVAQGITASVTKQTLLINIDVPTKHMPMHIVNGESGQLPDGWDWNSDTNILEIVNDQKQVILQEIYVEPNVVLVRGATQVGDSVFYYGSWAQASPQSEPHVMYNPDDVGLRRIFDYPSSKYKGLKERNWNEP
jgi:hypothetical protein